MKTQSTKLDWDMIGLVIGVFGVLLQVLVFIIETVQGSTTNIIALRILGVLGIGLWVAWVTFSIVRLQNRTKATQPHLGTEDTLEDYVLKTVYFDGTGRNFLNEVTFGQGSDAKDSDIQGLPLAEAKFERDGIRIQRIHTRFRWIMSIIKYQNTGRAKSDRFIPADSDPTVRGQFIRFIYFEFKAYVEREPHHILLRLRNTRAGWLRDASDKYVERKLRVTHNSWEPFDGVLGPIRADEPCLVSLDILPGPKSPGQALFIKDLRIIDVREGD